MKAFCLSCFSEKSISLTPQVDEKAFLLIIRKTIKMIAILTYAVQIDNKKKRLSPAFD